MKPFIFIINEKAGNGTAKKVWNKLKNELEQKKINYQAFYTEYPGHAEELAKQICLEYKTNIKAIIAVGGDGTMHEVVNGIADNPTVKAGFIPAGSGNDFSRGFRVPKSPHEALAFILKNRPNRDQLFDIGNCRVEGLSKNKYFVNSIGTGFDAAVSKLTNESKIKKYLNKFGLGSLAYAGAVIRLLFTYKLTNLVLEVGGVPYRYERVWFATVSNQPYYGGGMKIAPQAKTTDGLLDVTIVYNLSRLKLLFVFVTVFFGSHTRFKEVALHQGARISIDSEDKRLVHADGELIGHTPLTAEVQHGVMPFWVKS